MHFLSEIMSVPFISKAERNNHITTHGGYWEDPNYDSDDEDEDAVLTLQMEVSTPHTEGAPNIDDIELDLRSRIRVTRRSAMCIVEDDPSGDSESIHIYHTFQNSADARDENELSCVKLPRTDFVSLVIKVLFVWGWISPLILYVFLF